MTHLREFYRIRYPERGRPWLIFGGISVPVVDLSESGARVVLNALLREEDLRQEVQLLFPDGSEFTTFATFVRAHEDTIAIKFERLVPLARILHEQHRLRQQFSHLD